MASTMGQPTPQVHQDPGMHQNQITAASAINVILGLWLIISPWIFAYTLMTGALWNSIIVGVIIVIVALIHFFNRSHLAWPSWINIVLGLWTIISPWVFGYSSVTNAMWNSVIVGVLVAAVAVWNIIASNS